jgi:hypothetical protein
MSRSYLTLVCVSVFMLCCSLSKCKEDKTPGPLTTIQGVVTEDKTDKPLPNVSLQIRKRYFSGFLSPGKYSDYNIVTTNDKGEFSLKFTPLGTGDFTLNLLTLGYDNYFPSYFNNVIELGQENSYAIKLSKIINLTVHLKNNSTQNKTGFHVFISSCCGSVFTDGSTDIGHVVVDTVLKYKLAQLNTYTFQSLYFNGYVQSGPQVGTFADTLSFKKEFQLGTKDTTITIINP